MEILKNSEMKDWVLLMCYISKEHGGISPNKLYEKRPREIIEWDQVSKPARELKREGLISEDPSQYHPDSLNFNYIITKTGEAELKKWNSKRYNRVVCLTPPEHYLGKRIERIEGAFFHGFLSLMFFLIATLLKSYFIAFIFFGIFSYWQLLKFISDSSKIIENHIANVIKKWSGKTYYLLDKRAKSISAFIFMIIIGLVLLIWYLLSEDNFKNNLGSTIILLILSAGYLINNPIKNSIEKWLETIKEKIKS